jgi:hypothetical protein
MAGNKGISVEDMIKRIEEGGSGDIIFLDCERSVWSGLRELKKKGWDIDVDKIASKSFIIIKSFYNAPKSFKKLNGVDLNAQIRDDERVYDMKIKNIRWGNKFCDRLRMFFGMRFYMTAERIIIEERR